MKGREEQLIAKREKEFEDLRKIAELPGIDDLIAVYGEYEKSMRTSMMYLKEIYPKFISTTTNRTS